MRETITMTSREQQRAQVLTRLLVGDVTAGEAALLLGLSERQIFRLRAGYERDGPAALVHGNRGRVSPRRLDPALAERILVLARTTYDGANDCHLAELLAEHEGIAIGRASLRRLLRAAGQASPRRRRAPRHRSRRDRMPQAGMLLQVDGSRHDWLEGRGPRLTLVGAIDDATGRLTGAVFREQEDTAGYLIVLRDTVRRHGIPLAVYRDRHTLFETPRGSLMTLEEQLADTRTPTQLGRAFEELGITSIAARSPQAKGRIERAWGTLQDRLVTELRLAGADDLPSANAVLAPLPAPLRPALRCARGGPGSRLAPVARRHPDRADLLPQVPPGRRQRPHGPGGRDDPPAATGTRPPGLCRPTGRGPAAARRPDRRVGRRARGARRAGTRRSRAAPSARVGPRRHRFRRPQCSSMVGHHPGPAPSLAQDAGQRPADHDPTDRITEQMT
jgi:transposase